MTTDVANNTNVGSDGLGESYQTIRHAAALIDYAGAGLFEITGTGAGRFLSTVTTREVDFLLEGQSQQALILDQSGQVVSDVTVYGLGEGFLLQIWPDQAEAVGSILVEVAAGADDVDLTVVSADRTVIGIEGPTSFTLVDDYLDFPISSLAYKSWAEAAWQGDRVMISRNGVTGEFGYLLICPASLAGDLWEAFLAAGARPVGRDAVDVCRMEMRFSNLEAELPPGGADPFSLGLSWMIDFSGEFVGRDALLEREGEGPLQVCWQGSPGEHAVPSAGDEVRVDGEAIGVVLHAVYSPALNRPVGTALVDRSCAATGLTFSVGDDQIETVSAPFVIATSFTTSMESS